MILFLCRQIEVSKKHYTVVSWYSVVHVDGICAKLPRHFFPFSFFSLKILSFSLILSMSQAQEQQPMTS